MDSLEEARANLSQRGIFLNVKTIQSIVYKWAQRARRMQKAGAVVYYVSLNGRRVVISTDGGRVRIRTNKRGKKTNKGRNRYHTKWREPKLLIIYVTKRGRSQRNYICSTYWWYYARTRCAVWAFATLFEPGRDLRKQTRFFSWLMVQSGFGTEFQLSWNIWA